MAVDLKPTEEMAEEAARGLAWREEFGRGGTAVGVARARDISNRTNLSPSTVRRMVSYFARHEVDKEGEGFSPGEDGYPSAGRIAWALWGGDPGKSWANRKSDELDREEDEGEKMDSNTIRRKLVDLTNIKVKLEADDRRTFSGYASVFNGVDSYGDTIMPGAYAETLENRSRPVQMRWNHLGPVIGKWTKIYEDEKGLYVEGELTPDHSVAEDVYASLKHGAITGLSIGYRPVKSMENETGGEDLYEIDLIEISVVESPADMNAQIASVKSKINDANSLKEIESLLRDVGGFSRSDATSLVSRVKAISNGERLEKPIINEDEKAKRLVEIINSSVSKIRGI
jgi:HK97 family phage prohead protease